MKRKTESKVSDKKKKKRTNFKEKETGAKYQIKMKHKITKITQKVQEPNTKLLNFLLKKHRH